MSTDARQTVLLGSNPSVGQLAVVPSQFSATSQPPATAARHFVPVVTKASAGHAGLTPLHTSALSQSPTEARHSVPIFSKTSAGHVAELPLHISALSQSPTEARQTVPLGSNPSVGQLAEAPLQLSATSQYPEEARQTVLSGSNPSIGHTSDEPVQVSITSQLPLDARHKSPAVLNLQVSGLQHSPQCQSRSISHSSLSVIMPLPQKLYFAIYGLTLSPAIEKAPPTYNISSGIINA